MDATVNCRGAVNFLEEVLLDVRPTIEQRYARELASISHRYDVDDLYQSVCVRAIRWIGRCKGESKEAVRNWVLKIAANVFRSAIATHKLSAKRSTSRERATVATSGDEPHVEPWSEPVESVRLMVGEQCRHMRACIDRLKPPQWKDVKLVYLDPPYWIQAQGQYSQDAEDLGNQSLEVFTVNLAAIINQYAKKLSDAYIALIIQPTQWKAPDRQFTDHVGDMLRAVKLPVDMRYSVPYESQQCTAQMVEWSKENKRCLVLTREIVVWRVQ